MCVKPTIRSLNPIRYGQSPYREFVLKYVIFKVYSASLTILFILHKTLKGCASWREKRQSDEVQQHAD